ncbi:MAG: adenylate/guanylate cyclase domain-containing protein [Burkholderiales bacterium]|nr:adenylate/guanylate cyclase domain-containing protein [Burkholderiales bacterium]
MHPPRRTWSLRAAALALALAVAAAVQFLAPSMLSGVEESAGDLAWRLGGSTQPERRVVVVDIDEASLREIGPWPWPRATTAALAGRIAEAGAALRVFDIGFADAQDGDDRLADALRLGPAVLGQVFSLDEAVTPRTGELAGSLAALGCPAFAPAGYGAYGSAPALLAAQPAVGHMTPRIERDGVVRKLPALICHEGRAYPSLALAAIWRLVQPEAVGPATAPTDANPDWVWHSAGASAAPVIGFTPPAWLSSASLPGLVVPLDAQGDVRVPYRVDRRAVASIPAARVLRGDADLALLRGAIAVIGATAFGAGDVVATPQAAVASGVEVHVQLLTGLLDRRLPYTPQAAPLLQAAAIAAGTAALLLVVAVGGRALRRLPVAGVLGALALCGGAQWTLLAHELWLPWALPALFMLLAATTLAVAEHALTLLQRERLSAHLGAYLPQPVAQRLAATEPTGQVQVEEREVSVLVADIRNFSAFAAHRPAQETITLLHAFSTLAVEVVERHGGVVERVAADSILAVWNAFSPCASHPRQAMDAACELLQTTRALLAAPALERDDGLVQPLALGIGIEAGKAIVGSFGPARRRAHAALGEPVSVAARIQQMTADLSVPILVGPRLAAQLGADRVESLGNYLLEGLGRECPLFVPVDWAELAPVDPAWARAASRPASPAEAALWARWAGLHQRSSSLRQRLPSPHWLGARDA